MNDSTEDNDPQQATSLAEAIAWAGLDIPADRIDMLDAYRQVLWDWNEKINLTRHTTLEKFAGRDLLDTVKLAAHLEPGDRVLDIGSGGGVPGLPLAILRPDLMMSVCDSVGKKARVLEEMVAALGLPVKVYPARA
jgi:16S rRNA (guanine527-N7)-methyltransferase